MTRRDRCHRCGELLVAGACPAHGAGAPAPATGGVTFGFFDLLRGASYTLRHPGLWPYVILPFLVNCLLWWLLYRFCVEEPIARWVEPWVKSLGSEDRWWMPVLTWTARIGISLVFAFLALVLFGFLGSLAGAPFYDFLSEAVEKRYLGTRPGGGGGSFVARFARSFLASLKAGLYILMWYVLWLPVQIVPVIGTTLYFLAMARLRTFELLVFVFARKHYRLAEMRAFMNRTYVRSFGLGGALNLCILVPALLGVLSGLPLLPLLLAGGVAMLATPLAVVGGTLLYLDSEGK